MKNSILRHFGKVKLLKCLIEKKKISFTQANCTTDAVMLMLQTIENMVLGQTQKGGPAAIMQATMTQNERAGLVSHR
jgi:hypothetical protein